MADKSIKAELKIQLLAGEVLVAESLDKKLWTKVLAEMELNHHTPEFLSQSTNQGAEESKNENETELPALNLFANELGVEKEFLEGACGPTLEPPFIHLDEHCWESLKKNTPSRGPNAIPPICLAATILCLWFKYLKRSNKPTLTDSKAVLETINLTEGHPSRSIKNCEWLQYRNNCIQLNPSKMSNALAIVKGYSLQQPINHES